MTNIPINGEYHNYVSLRANVFGRTLRTIQELNYSRTDDIDPVKVAGTAKPIGFTQGNETYEGTVTLLLEEVTAIQSSLPKGKSLPDIPPFPMSVSYVNKLGIQISHLLIGVKFKSNGVKVSAGNNEAITVEIPLYIGDIDFTA